MADAKRAFTLDRHREAEDLARRVLEAEPNSSQALLLAGRAAAKSQRFQAAIEYFDSVSGADLTAFRDARFAAGEILYYLGRYSDAEPRLRQAIETDPELAQAHRLLSALLSTENRRWESIPHLFELIRLDQFGATDLLLLANTLALNNETPLLEVLRGMAPDDAGPMLGQAVLEVDANRRLALLRKIVDLQPNLIEAQARLGHTLVDVNASEEEFFAWHAALPPEADSHPDIWFARGAFAMARGENDVAQRCFWECARRHPDHPQALDRLKQLLLDEGRAEAAAPFGRRATLLNEYDLRMRPVKPKTPEPSRVLDAAILTEKLGRLWEAWAWRKLLLSIDRGRADGAAEVDRLAALLKSNPPRVSDSANPALAIDLSALPMPAWTKREPSAQPTPDRSVDGVTFDFVDRASSAGIEFRYNNGDDASTPGMQIYQELAGGIAAIDYDADGWPDLYFGQGSDWPNDPAQTRDRDRLFRNSGTGVAIDVTLESGLGDTSFTQGVTVGDFDSDGFADLYVANVGRNRLYRNQGDGTFVDVTEQAGIGGDLWTSSVLVADLNGDGLPDLYDVTYLTGKAPFEKTCPDNGKLRACGPSHFDAEKDRVWVNLGDGRFEDQSARSGVASNDPQAERDYGKGLGIVAADFDGSGRLSLFIANDETPNFFFANETPTPGADPKFVESALAYSLHADEDGRSQACMGIAAGDANGDGQLDLFVTNFYQESNTLYVRKRGPRFRDETRKAGLRDPSLATLGFGAQFLDGDLDGKPDLVVANGHVDDFRHRNYPYRMHPQFFRNLGGGSFREIPSTSLGAYFQGEYLGRSLARLDWNRDGREDFAVAHLEDRWSLVLNETKSVGRHLIVELRGVKSARDAIGATVTISVNGSSAVRQLTAGDGFEASNERKLVFGLGNADVVDRLSIRWRSRVEESFRDLSVDHEYLFVEGFGEPILRPQSTK